MKKKYIEYQDFKDLTSLEKGEYEFCTFTDCRFSEADLSNIVLSECSFDQCDLSNADVRGASFRTVRFKNCKMLGLHFDDCNQFGISFRFENCLLDFASFYQLRIPNTLFRNCSLKSVEFIETDLTSSVFDRCDFAKAIFEQSKLENGDFRTSDNFSINPALNRVKKARFSKENVVGLLNEFGILVE